MPYKIKPIVSRKLGCVNHFHYYLCRRLDGGMEITMENIHKDVAIVTGSSSGIGRAIAIALARKGVKVALVARDAKKLEEVKSIIEKSGGESIVVAQDLMIENSVVSIIECVQKRLGAINILVNAAGRVAMGGIDKINMKLWESVIHLNLTIPYEFIHYLLPEMKEHKRGWIFNISSEIGIQATQYSGVYGVSKAALNRLSEILDLDISEFGIHIYSLCPGWVNTKLAIDPNLLGVDKNEILQPEQIAKIVTDLYEINNYKLSTILKIAPMNHNVSTENSTKKFFELNKHLV